MDLKYIYIGIAIVAILLLFLIAILVKQNRLNEPESDRHKNSRTGKGMGSGIAIGLSVGVAIGVAMDNIALGIAIGVAIGTSLGASFESAAKKRSQQGFSDQDIYLKDTVDSRKKMLTLALLLVFGILLLVLFFLFYTK